MFIVSEIRLFRAIAVNKASKGEPSSTIMAALLDGRNKRRHIQPSEFLFEPGFRFPRRIAV